MRLNYKRTVLIGFGFMSILAFWQFYDLVISFFLENIFHLGAFSANAIMAVDNVLAIFMLPLFGALSDKTNTRLGKRTPYILFGTIAAVILVPILGFFVENRNFLGFVITLMALLVVMSTYRSPAVAYMPDVTEKPLRSKGNAIINLVGYIGGIFANFAVILMLKSEKDENGKSVYLEDQSFLPIFFVIAAFMLITVLIMVFSVNENKVLKETNIKPDTDMVTGIKEKMPKPVFKSLILILLSVFLWYVAYNSAITSLSRFCYEVWDTDLAAASKYTMVATITAIISFVPLGFLSSRFGRKKSVLFGILLVTAGYGSVIFMTRQTPLIYLTFAIVGIGWAAINVNSYPMVVEMSKGSDVGKYTGYYYTFSMAAQIVGPLLSGLLIDNAGIGYRILFPFAFVFSVLSFLTMLFVKHGDGKPEKGKSLLENFDVDD